MTSPLDEAKHLVHGDRRNSYDHPADNLTQTAELFTAYLKRKLIAPLDARDVSWLMVLLKASRDSFKRGADNLTDAAGYIECAHLVQKKEDK